MLSSLPEVPRWVPPLLGVVQHHYGDSIKTKVEEPLVDGVPFLFGVLIDSWGQGGQIVENDQLHLPIQANFFGTLSPLGVC